MEATLERIAVSVQQADTPAALQAATETLRDALAVSHIVYHWVNSKGERFGVGTYSSEWVDRYLEKDYLFLDPVIYGCLQRFHPVEWKELDWSRPQARAMFQDALQYGVGNQGLTIPVRGPSGQFALFTANNHCEDEAWAGFVETWCQDLIIIAHEFNKRALEFEHFAALPPSTLSPRELGALSCIAKGQSRAKAAEHLGISEHTLRVYLETARHKLGAMNTTHAVARALSHGLIVV